MISVDISNIWGAVSLPELLAMESEVAAAHEKLTESTEAGSEYRECLHLPGREPNPELFRILLAAERIRNDSDICVVAGVDGGCTGARAAMELLQGVHRNIGKGKGDPQIFFAGNNLSTRHWNELMQLLKDKDFSVIVISRSVMEIESAVAFRSLRWMLERKYGTDAAKQRIYVVTDPQEGTLCRMVQEEGWESFAIPADAGGQYSVLTAAGLLPMAVAGIDIREIINGAAEAREEYAFVSFENPVWLYVAVRNLLYRKGKGLEILGSFETGFRMFGTWWQQLFAGSEGKNGSGLYPAVAELTGDLYSLGQLIQEGPGNLFETMVRFLSPENRMTIGSDWKNLDDLNFLEGRTLDFIEENAFQCAVTAHTDGGVPVIVMDCGELTEQKVGELFGFLEISSGISAGLMGVDPFGQPGVETYQQNLFRMLGKPDSN